DLAYGIAQDQLAALKFTGSTSWDYMGGGGENGKVLVDLNNSQLLYVSNPLNLAHLVSQSKDGGHMWTTIFSSPPVQDDAYGLANATQKSFVMDPADSSVLLIGTNQVWKTTDAQDPSPVWVPFSQVGDLTPSTNAADQRITALATS